MAPAVGIEPTVSLLKINGLPDGWTPDSSPDLRLLARVVESWPRLSAVSSWRFSRSLTRSAGKEAEREGIRPSPKTATHPTNENRKPDDAGSRDSATGTDGCGYLSKGERVYLEIVAAESGREIPAEAFEKKKAERDLLMAQSIHIADMLESVGVKAYGESKLTMVGLLSGIEEPMIDFRNIVFIPAVAKRKRNRVLGDLEYFIQNHPYSRMWVFTSGARCPIEAVADRIKEVHRRISKLNAKPFMKAAGISIVFRATELGSLQRVEGKPTFHIHCHAIIHLGRKLGKDAWSLLLGKVREWWQFHFADARKIEMAREACKYVVKPGDLLNYRAGTQGAAWPAFQAAPRSSSRPAPRSEKEPGGYGPAFPPCFYSVR